jgi:hypothetical protein
MTLLLPLLLLCLLGFGSALADDDDDEDDRGAALSALNLAAEQEAMAGLIHAKLEPVVWGEETVTTGKVLDIQPLLAFRGRYRAARAEAVMARAGLALAQKNRLRLAGLYREQIVAGRTVAEAEAQYASEVARSLAADNRVEDIRDETVQSLGPELANLILDPPGSLLKDWIERRRVLLLISVPGSGMISPATTTVRINRLADPVTAQRAELISRAPVTDDLTQGETFYYHAPSEGLRSGMRLQVWIRTGGEVIAGVRVPYSAIVWQDGKSWVYRYEGAHRYVRVEVSSHRDDGPDWLVSEGLRPGDSLVVRGAQTLLSETLKRQIPGEEEDDD